MLRLYICYCIFAFVCSIIMAMLIWDMAVADNEDITVPGYVAPVQQTIST